MADDDTHSELLTELTGKQREVLDLLIEHKTSKEIARELRISHHTVDQRIDFAKRKLGVQSRGDLALRYRELIALYEPLTYEDSRMVRPAMAMEGQRQDEAGYYLLQPAPIPSNSSSEDEKDGEYRIVPEMLDGPYAAYIRLGAVCALALSMMLVVLGGLAIFSQLSSLLEG